MQKDLVNIIPISFGFVNAYLIKGSDQSLSLIDCGVPGSEKKILKTISDMGLNKRDLKLIIITHGHSDHMGACSALRKETNARTIIHRADVKAVQLGKQKELHPINTMGKLFGRLLGADIKGFEPYEPEIIVDQELPLNEYGISGKLLETPGHTDGSLSVFLEDGSLFVGDLIQGGMIGKGKPGFPMYADSMEDLKKSIEKVIKLSPKMIYVGHGGPFTLDEIKKYL